MFLRNFYNRDIHGSFTGDGMLTVHADGVQAAVLHNAQSFTVTRSPRFMPFVDCQGATFYDSLNGKLMKPLKGGA